MNLDNINKIKWKLVGKFLRDKQNCFGKMKNIRCCPGCDSKEMILYKSGARYKLVCEKCSYELITDKFPGKKIVDEVKNDT